MANKYRVTFKAEQAQGAESQDFDVKGVEGIWAKWTAAQRDAALVTLFKRCVSVQTRNESAETRLVACKDLVDLWNDGTDGNAAFAALFGSPRTSGSSGFTEAESLVIDDGIANIKAALDAASKVKCTARRGTTPTEIDYIDAAAATAFKRFTRAAGSSVVWDKQRILDAALEADAEAVTRAQEELNRRAVAAAKVKGAFTL